MSSDQQLIAQARDHHARTWTGQGWRAEPSLNGSGYEVWALDRTGQYRIVLARGLTPATAALMCFVSTALPRLCDLAARQPSPITDLMEIADRGELAPDVELRAYWGAFCDADPSPDDFADRMEAAGLINLGQVTTDDLDDPFASERGIEPGGSVWRLTAAGEAVYRATSRPPAKSTPQDNANE